MAFHSVRVPRASGDKPPHAFPFPGRMQCSPRAYFHGRRSPNNPLCQDSCQLVSEVTGLERKYLTTSAAHPEKVIPSVSNSSGRGNRTVMIVHIIRVDYLRCMKTLFRLTGLLNEKSLRGQPSLTCFRKASGILPLPDHVLVSPFSSSKIYFAFLTPPLGFRLVSVVPAIAETGPCHSSGSSPTELM